VILNTPTNYPEPGNVVVWGPYLPLGIGPDGHCAIAILADARWMLTFDQNYPLGHPCAVMVHGYGGVKGWMARKPP
jgi:hypothetical protein